MAQEVEIKETIAWIKEFVIKHNLCPFANKPVSEKKVKYELVNESIGNELKNKFLEEVRYLISDPNISNSFLVCPKLNGDFLSYIHFIYELEECLVQEELEDAYQVASFHPLYQFAGTLPGDVTNRTNRSPHALIHILRGAEMEQAIKQHGNTDQIPFQNIEKMKKLFQ